MDEETTVHACTDIYEACAEYRQPTERSTEPAFTHRNSPRGLCRGFATRDGCPLSHDLCPMKHCCWVGKRSEGPRQGRKGIGELEGILAELCHC
jgi:hypothetical protein